MITRLKLKSFKRDSMFGSLAPIYFVGIFVVFQTFSVHNFSDFIFNYLLYCIYATIGGAWMYREGISKGYWKRIEEETRKESK